jgi:hypothetical protein
VGDLVDSTKCICLELHVIPRLKWVVVWVRGDLMIWDYDKEEVVHWITMEEGEFDLNPVPNPNPNLILCLTGT